MGAPWGALFAILFATLVGYGAVRMIVGSGRRLGCIEAVSYGFPVGIGLLTLGAFLLDRTGVGLSFWTMVLPGLLILGPFGYRMVSANRSEKTRPTSLNPSYTTMQVASIVAITLGLGIVLVSVLLSTVTEWDALSFWSLKGKAFYIDRTVDPEFLHLYSHPDYPLNLSLAHTWVYLCGGQEVPDDRTVRLLAFAFYASLAGLFYTGLRDSIGRTNALLFTALLALMPHLLLKSSVMLADSPLAAYLLACLIALRRSLGTPIASRPLALAALCGGLAAWTKSEGTLYLVVVAMVLGAFCLIQAVRQRSARSLVVFGLFLAILIGVSLPWTLYKGVHNLRNDVLSALLNTIEEDGFETIVSRMTQRWPTVLAYTRSEMLYNNWMPGNWGLLWPGLLLAVLLYPGRLKEGRIGWLFLILCGWFVVIIFPFLLTQRDVVFHMKTALDRLLLQIVPASLFLLALICSKEPTAPVDH